MSFEKQIPPASSSSGIRDRKLGSLYLPDITIHSPFISYTVCPKCTNERLVVTIYWKAWNFEVRFYLPKVGKGLRLIHRPSIKSGSTSESGTFSKNMHSSRKLTWKAIFIPLFSIYIKFHAEQIFLTGWNYFVVKSQLSIFDV